MENLRQGEESQGTLRETLGIEATLTSRVISTIIKDGYNTAVSYGKENNNKEELIRRTNVIPIIDPKKGVGCSNILYALFTSSVNDYIGDLYLEDKELGAERDVRWVLHVYGEENTDRLYALAEKLKEEFGVDIEGKRKDLYAKSRYPFRE